MSKAAVLGSVVLALSLIALGGFALLVNVFLLYTEGRPAEYAVPSVDAASAAVAGR